MGKHPRDYEGEIDEEGRACGYGTAMYDKGNLTGFWFNDLPHCMCK